MKKSFMTTVLAGLIAVSAAYGQPLQDSGSRIQRAGGIRTTTEAF